MRGGGGAKIKTILLIVLFAFFDIFNIFINNIY